MPENFVYSKIRSNVKMHNIIGDVLQISTHMEEHEASKAVVAVRNC